MKRFQNKWKERDYEFFLFLLYFVFMAVYYGFRLFTLTPWYDELYTYHCFISKGPIYAAIHWPLPNNHVGYSVLSGFLTCFGNGYIALRGIAYLASLGNLCLIFLLGRRMFCRGMALLAVVLFGSASLINSLAIQGRGYSLTTLFFLLALWALWHIVYENDKIGFYCLWAISLTAGLYVVPSSLYWVISVCLAGGICLLVEKKYARLGKLIMYSIFAAFMTVILYGVIWLAIGSNLLVKDPESIVYGMGHVKAIISHPILSAQSGIQYMLDQPYIQSVERSGYLLRLADYIKSLYQQFFGSFWMLYLAISCIAIIASLAEMIRKRFRDKQICYLSVFFFSTLIVTPIVLLIQAKLPYFRVFSYIGIPIVFAGCYFLQKILKSVKLEKQLMPVILFLVLIISIGTLDAQMVQYGSVEHAIEDAYRTVDPREYDNVCVADCNSQYLLNLLYDIECENQIITDCDYVVLHKNMLDPDYNEFQWEYYLNYDTIDWSYMKEHMTRTYENDLVVLFTKMK